MDIGLSMNRRTFLRALLVGTIASAIELDKLVESTLIETAPMSDADFVAYITYSMNLYCSNPAQCVIITDIGVE